MENEAAEQRWLESMAAQQTLTRMTDKPGQWRGDGLDAFRSLLKAQADAMRGDDGGFSAMTAPF
jgi:hypothetical protein